MAKRLRPFLWVLGGAVVLGAGAATAAALSQRVPELAAGDGSAGPQPALPEPAPLPGPDGLQLGRDASSDQAVIISAFWVCVNQGDDSGVRLLQAKLPLMVPELQVYMIAAAQSAIGSYKSFLKWQEAFPHELEEANRQADDVDNQLNAGLGVVAAAVNVIPVAGQLLSALLAIGIGLKKAFAQNHIERKVADNLHLFRDWEGSDCLRGLHLGGVNPNDVTPQKLRSRIDADLIACRLPSISFGHQFDFTPTVETFREVAKSKGLYSNSYLKAAYGFPSAYNNAEGDDIPTTAYEISAYVAGYQWGQEPSGEGYASNQPWANIGYTDARAGRPSRVSTELGHWADVYLNGV